MVWGKSSAYLSPQGNLKPEKLFPTFLFHCRRPVFQGMNFCSSDIYFSFKFGFFTISGIFTFKLSCGYTYIALLISNKYLCFIIMVVKVLFLGARVIFKNFVIFSCVYYLHMCPEKFRRRFTVILSCRMCCSREIHVECFQGWGFANVPSGRFYSYLLN